MAGSTKVRTCKRCKLSKSISDYYHSLDSRDGVYRPASYCKICSRAKAVEWQQNNPEKIKARRTKADRKYYKKNKQYYIQKSVERKKRLKTRTPIWADLDAIMFFYACCPKGLEVDHIIPIKGKIASGLHCIENLQYISKSANAEKQNKWPWPEDLYNDKFD